jgi:hypothetical protein
MPRSPLPQVGVPPKPTTTLSIYAHLFEDDHADAMAALGVIGNRNRAENVIPLHG